MDDELLRGGARVVVCCAGADGRGGRLSGRRILPRPILSSWCMWSASDGSAWRCAARCSSSCRSSWQSRCFRRSGRCRRLACLTAGLAALLAGFLGLGGRLPAWLWLLPVGAVLLIAGFGLVVVDLGLTAWLRPAGPARFVLVGLASLCATVSLRRDLRVCACGLGGIGRGNASGQRHSAARDSRARRLADVDGHGGELPVAVHVHAVSRCGRPARAA